MSCDEQFFACSISTGGTSGRFCEFLQPILGSPVLPSKRPAERIVAGKPPPDCSRLTTLLVGTRHIAVVVLREGRISPR